MLRSTDRPKSRVRVVRLRFCFGGGSVLRPKLPERLVSPANASAGSKPRPSASLRRSFPKAIRYDSDNVAERNCACLFSCCLPVPTGRQNASISVRRLALIRHWPNLAHVSSMKSAPVFQPRVTFEDFQLCQGLSGRSVSVGRAFGLNANPPGPILHAKNRQGPADRRRMAPIATARTETT